MKNKYYKGLVDDEPKTWVYGTLSSNNSIFQAYEPSKGNCGIGIFSVVPNSITEITEEQYAEEFAKASNQICGIVRSVTSDGRICVPSEFRHRAGIKTAGKVELFLTLMKEVIICTSENNTRDFVGIERPVAENGQISIPVEYRKAIGLGVGNKAEVFLNAQNEIIIKTLKT
ncbi:MAG: AbrB/MazE/SpoVT family DNA-binding domain-containing protein [Clostridia bacterium]|nr:AbrB/MazE/SpoVT family DNA-binding domain-containing protein [Clostridia bacterium]